MISRQSQVWFNSCIIDPAIVLQMCLSSFIFVIVCNSYKEGGVGISLTDLISPDSCVCPKARPGFLTSYVVVFFVVVLSEWRWEVIGRFVDISGIIDHSLFKLSFHIKSINI